MTHRTSSLRTVLRVTLVLSAIVGAGFSIHANQTLRQLHAVHAELKTQIGYLDIQDASKVVISSVPVQRDAIPPGVEKAHVWRFRMHLPKDFGPCYSTRRGNIAADSPRNRGGGGSSWSSPNADPQDVIVTLSLVKNDGSWMFCRTTNRGASASGLPEDFPAESLSELLIEPVVAAGEESQVFDPDQPICLLRLREKTLAKKYNGETETDFYRGVAVYLFESKQQPAYEAWANGETDSFEVVKE